MKKFPGKLGIMQGRLSPPKDNLIQHYPSKTWEKEFSYCSDLGLECIEWVFEYPNFDHNEIFNDKGIEKIKNVSQRYNVEVNSVVADYFMVNKLFREDKNNLEANIDILHKLLIQCKNANIPIIELPFVDSSSMKSDQDKKEVIENLIPLLDIASDYDIKISLETDLEPKSFKKFVDSFNRSNVYINYDMGNSSSLGFNPKEEIGEYGDKIINVHIKDRIFGGSTVPLGSGNTDFEIVFNALSSINYQHDFIFQSARQDIEMENPVFFLDTVKEYIKFIKRF